MRDGDDPRAAHEVGYEKVDLRARGPLVGRPVRRVEDPRLLTGQGRYVDDRTPPRTLHLALRRSDQPHARIRSIDTRAAAAMPGVAGVYTWTDLEGLIQPATSTSKMPSYQPTPIHPLAKDVVRFVGEAIVAVLAESRYLAEDAAEQVVLDLEPLPIETHPRRAAEPSAPRLHESLESNVIVSRAFVRGEVDEAFERAALRVQADFRFHRKSPLALEPRSYLAEPEPGRDALTLYTSSQTPGIVRDALATLLDLPGSQITVIAPDVGGGFGGKTSLYQEEMLTAVIARRTGRPVKWTGDRLEDLLSTSQAFDEFVLAELALDEEGHLLALAADVVGDVGAYSVYPWTGCIEPVQVASFIPGPYRLAAYRCSTRAVCTPKSMTGPYRGVGRPISTFVMERLMDMAAHKLKLDPVEIRRRNLVQPHEFPYRAASGIIWDRSGFIEGLEGAAARFEYDAARERQAAARAEGRWIGIGVASYAELSGIGSRISASPGMPINTGTDTCVMSFDSTGSVTAAFGSSAHGQGHETTLAQVVADELGARFTDVRVINGNSGAVPHGTGSYASRTAVISGGAGILAARELKARLLRAAGVLLGVEDVALLRIEGSTVHSAVDGRTITFPDLARACYSQMGRISPDKREELTVTRVYDPVVGTTTSSTHMVELEIDPGTFSVHIHRYVVAEDCGRIINPLIVDGQARGAVAQGIGAALLEEVVYDAQGQLLTASMVDYLAPTAPEMPNVEIVHIETQRPDNIGGFRGMGEGGTIGAPAAVANAIADALQPLGIEITELPATPDRLFKLVREARRTSAQTTP